PNRRAPRRESTPHRESQHASESWGVTVVSTGVATGVGAGTAVSVLAPARPITGTDSETTVPAGKALTGSPQIDAFLGVGRASSALWPRTTVGGVSEACSKDAG